MASTKRILNQGKKFVQSASNKRMQGLDGKTQDTDDSHEESPQTSEGDKMFCYDYLFSRFLFVLDKRQKMIQPNAFLSFRITNDEVKELDY